jgi:amino acid adenylation domain-containing protein
MQVEDFLEQSARLRPDKTALIYARRRWTYRELDERANRLAHALAGAGLERWDRVAIQLENSVEALLAVFATLKAGGVFLLVNPQVKPDKLAYILNDSGATMFVTSSANAARIPEIIDSLPALVTVVTVGPCDQYNQCHPDLSACGLRSIALEDAVESVAGGSEPPAARNIDVDLAALIYTSGSTGVPKGVMLTHRNIVAAATSITTYLENTPDDVILNVLPLSFDYGLYQAFMAFKTGATLVLERSFGYPREMIRTIVRERVTGLPLVPTMSTLLLQLDLTKHDFSSLRYITNTAAALSTGNIRRLREAFPHVKIFSMYGLTECKRVSYLPPDQIDERPTSVGRGMPNEEVYIVDADGRKVGPGVVGELVVRGANVMKGYWNQPVETARVLKPGPFPDEKVLYTGDLFRMDDEGYLYWVARKDDIIKTRGEKVSPREVEEAIVRLPGVADVTVFGVADELLGEAVAAVVIPMQGATFSVEEVRRHCGRHLEYFMVPKFVDIRDTLPVTDNGKPNRRALRLEVTG